MNAPSVLRACGHTVAAVWAAFWIITGAWTGYGTTGSIAGALQYGFVPGGIFLMLVMAVWHWERMAAWAILLCGLAIIYHSAQQPALKWSMLLLAGPPLVGGILLLIYRRWIPVAAASGIDR